MTLFCCIHQMAITRYWSQISWLFSSGHLVAAAVAAASDFRSAEQRRQRSFSQLALCRAHVFYVCNNV